MSDKMQRISATIRIDQANLINTINLNFSEWLRKKLDEEFQVLENLEKRKRTTQEDLEKIDALYKQEVLKRKAMQQMKEDESSFWEETKIILDKDHKFLEGRYDLYTKIYKKDLSLTEFLIKLRKFERGGQNE